MADASEVLDDAMVEAMFDPSKKKKKKSKKAAGEGEVSGDATTATEPSTGSVSAPAAASSAPAGDAAPGHATAAAASTAVAAGGDDEMPAYEDMLSRIYGLLYANNPDLTDRTRKKLKPPQVMRVGTTRTAWINFKEICTILKRAPDHMQSFFLNELGTTGSVDGNERLLIKGKLQPKYIESLLRKYITEYVTCHGCKSLDTDLTRDPISRLYFLSCKACGSSRSVAPIKAGFHATSKGERRKERAKEHN